MKVFVTGGTGFIGGEVARQLRDRGDDVVCLARTPEKAAKLTELGCQLVSGDLGDAEAIRNGMEGCDAVVHAAAMYEVGIPAKQHPAMYEANVTGTESVLKAAQEAKVRKIVYVSTVGTFGNTHGKVVDESYEHPGKEFTSYYEETKLEGHRIAERMIAEEGLPAVIVQPGGVYGPGDTSQVADLLKEFFAGRLFLLPFPELGICLTHVEDIAAGILLALDKGKAGETYVISGPATTMREAIEHVAAVSGRKAPKRDMPTALMKALTPIGPLVGKLIGQPPNLRELISSADGVTFWASHEKASRSSATPRAAWKRASARRSKRDERFPDPVRVSAPGAASLRCASIDVMHLGRPHVIGCWEVDGALVDPGPESSLDDAAGGARRRAAAGAAAHPHPPRPRGGDRRAGAALARPRGLRARARRAPPDRPLEAAGQRRAPLRRPDGAPLGRDRAGARGEREAAQRRRGRARHARRLHPRPRLPPRLLPARGERHRLRRRRRRGPHPGREPDRPPDAAAGHRHRDLARLDRDRRSPGAPSASR